MRRGSREPYWLVLACIGATLSVVALGAVVVLAMGHAVAPAFWAVGGVAIGILVSVVLPRPGAPPDQPVSDAGTQGPHAADAEEDKPRALAGSGDDGLTTAWRYTPLLPVLAIAAVAVLGLTLSVLLYTGEIHRAGCQLGGLVRDWGCDQPLLDLADVFIFIGSGAAGALLGLCVPQFPPQVSAAKSSPAPDVRTEKFSQAAPKDTSASAPEQAEAALKLGGGLLATLVGIVLLSLVVFVLLALLPRATASGARAFNIGSLGLTVAAVSFAAVATLRPTGKKTPWVLSAVVTAVLAFMSSTASGLVVNRFTSHSAGPGAGVTVTNYVVNPESGTPSVTVADTRSECVIYLAHFDDLVDDEPHIAELLPGKSFPFDQGARACGLKSAREMNAIAAALAAH